MSNPEPKARSAFTLRLTPEQSIRLNVAAARRRVSAQRLVLFAVETYLDVLEKEPL